MKTQLKHIAAIQSGIYSQPDIEPDILYLQANHFSKDGSFDLLTEPALKMDGKYERHLLQDGDILFATKGYNNFAVKFNNDIGKAVASSSFLVLRITDDYKTKILPEFLAWWINHPANLELLRRNAVQSTIPSISGKQLSNLEINVPMVEKQEIILKVHNLYNKHKEIHDRLNYIRNNYLQQQLLIATK